MKAINQDILDKAGEIGSSTISHAFSILTGSPVKVHISSSKKMIIAQAIEELYPYEEYPITVYSKMLNMAGGIILIINRSDALILVDLLSKKPIGTTNIIKDTDRSAIKETLNILANSYISAISEVASIEITLNTPEMVTSHHFKDIAGNLTDNLENSAIVFQTVLDITQYEIKANLYILFSDQKSS